MKNDNRVLTLIVALAGIGVCATALTGFLVVIRTNNLPALSPNAIRDHYLAVGQSYSQGFLVGFFLCFFMVLAAYAAGRRAERRAETSTAAKTAEDAAG